jgi:hypothetical protein
LRICQTTSTDAVGSSSGGVEVAFEAVCDAVVVVAVGDVAEAVAE